MLSININYAVVSITLYYTYILTVCPCARAEEALSHGDRVVQNSPCDYKPGFPIERFTALP